MVSPYIRYPIAHKPEISMQLRVKNRIYYLTQKLFEDEEKITKIT